MRTPRLLLSLGLVALFLVTGCTTETIVFRDREPFNPPPDASSGFLGYFTASTKQTTCGNCHVGTQRDWKGTAHASAYQTLASNPNSQAFCYGCHTINARGNRATGTVGHDAVRDSAYFDVQCESCHGPGLSHVTEPDLRTNWPFARAHIADTTASCASCHSGTHHPFAEEWNQSRHANVITSVASRDGCNTCHDGKATLRAWGETANYVERDSTGFFPVTCTVCHDPHGSPNSAQLRFAIDTPDPEQNLCMRCHMRRNEPAPGSSQGVRPHAPQGAVLLGTAGYRPPNFVYSNDAVLASHASDRNPRLCAGCHVNGFRVTDPASGNFVFQATGHLFRPDPCLDAEGKPTADKTCAYTATARSFASCTPSGCHASGAIAVQLLNGTRNDIENLARVLWIDSNNNGTIDAAPTDAGYLPTVKQTRPAEFTADAVITAAEGAEFNVRLAAERNQGNSDNSKGVHNPFLLKALVSASIDHVRTTYGLTAPPAPVQALMRKSLDAVKPGAPLVSARSAAQ